MDFKYILILIEMSINQNSLNNETWVISNSEDQHLLEKIKSISKPLNDFVKGNAKKRSFYLAFLLHFL